MCDCGYLRNVAQYVLEKKLEKRHDYYAFIKHLLLFGVS